jgi:hypothetical protein
MIAVSIIVCMMTLTHDTHMELARAWARWNGLKGTDAQAVRIMRRLTVTQLETMLTARGIVAQAVR